MGKDREGKFHPRKGKPSGSGREAMGLQPINTSTIDEHLEIAEKYTDEEEQPAGNVHVRHRNRNVDKREERSRNKEAQRSNNTANKSVNDTFTEALPDTTQAELPVRLTREQFVELANFQQDCCISFYMPTLSSPGVDVNRQKNFIGFKNKLQQIVSILKERNMNESEVETLLKPGYNLLRDERFWDSMSQGLAVFISDGYFKYVKLPVNSVDKILVNSKFYLTPLIPVMTSSDYFFVLVLSKKAAKLYRADAFGMEFIPVPGMPNGVEDVVHFENKGDKSLYRTDTSGAGAGANYHGAGTGRPEPKENLAMYFDEVDETLWKEVLSRENVPLLLVGVEYLIPIYKQVAKYKPIWDEAITGSHEHEDTSSLYDLARQVMEPYFQERISKALNIYGNQSATELTSSIVDDVIPAAHYGRVSHLFAIRNEHIWGSFDEMNNNLTIHEEQEDGDECMIDKAVIKTLLTGGEVFILPKERMPAQSKLAAVMRY